jgi:hypothetical protein
MSSSVTAVDSEPVNERNWYDKMTAAQKAHPGGDQWRKQFTPQEMEIIERCIDREIQWARKASILDLPGPRRFEFMHD